MGLVQPYFFKANAYMAHSHNQIQREVWGAITAHLQHSLKGKIIARGTDEIFFSAKKLHQLLEREEMSVVGFLDYLKDISLVWRFTQLLQKLNEMFDIIRRNSTNFRGSRKPKNSGPVIIEIDYGPGKIYEVNSVFGVVHALSFKAMRHDSPLGEYIVILYLLRRLVARFNSHLSQKGVKKSHISTSIGLLASFAGAGNQLYSRGVIGFSLTGTGKRRQNIIKQRKRNLPQLNQVQDHGLAWSPGNCAESETFACYKNMYESLKKRCGQFKIFTVSLTLSISQGFPIPFCAQCFQLARIIETESRHVIIDLASQS